MDRRTFVATAAAGALGLPLAVTAQRKLNNARIGVLLQTTPEGTKHLMMAFTKRLAELGWLEGKNIEYLLRYAQGNPSQYSTLIGETLAQKPDVIYAPFGPFALAAKKHTSNVPIVFSIVDDPVRLGLVASLTRPGGNATGVTTRSRELTGKQLQILKELVPTLRRIGVTGVVTTPEHVATVEEVRRTAAQLRLELVEVRQEWQELDRFDLAPAFTALKRERVEAVVGLVYLVWSKREEFVDHANRAGLPAMYDAEEFVQAGGLISYSVSYAERYREAANYVDRILRGARPADLPVEEPTRFTLALNLRTARSLGLEIPQSVLLRADRVIE
jgi:putative ABC transport system substrate-binding protein